MVISMARNASFNLVFSYSQRRTLLSGRELILSPFQSPASPLPDPIRISFGGRGSHMPVRLFAKG